MWTGRGLTRPTVSCDVFAPVSEIATDISVFVFASPGPWSTLIDVFLVLPCLMSSVPFLFKMDEKARRSLENLSGRQNLQFAHNGATVILRQEPLTIRAKAGGSSLTTHNIP